MSTIPICAKCRVEMTCLKNSIGCDYGGGHVRASDLFACPECGAVIALANAAATFDPEYQGQDGYLVMRCAALQDRGTAPKQRQAIVMHDLSGPRVVITEPKQESEK